MESKGFTQMRRPRHKWSIEDDLVAIVLSYMEDDSPLAQEANPEAAVRDSIEWTWHNGCSAMVTMLSEDNDIFEGGAWKCEACGEVFGDQLDIGYICCHECDNEEDMG